MSWRNRKATWILMKWLWLWLFIIIDLSVTYCLCFNLTHRLFSSSYSCIIISSYAIKSRKAQCKNDPVSQQLYYGLMLKEDSDAALLRVFECFLEAAPQHVLQTALLLRTQGNKLFTGKWVLLISVIIRPYLHKRLILVLSFATMYIIIFVPEI